MGVVVAVDGLSLVASSLILQHDVVVLLEVIDATLKPFHLPGILLIHLILVLVVMHPLILIHASGEFASEM